MKNFNSFIKELKEILQEHNPEIVFGDNYLSISFYDEEITVYHNIDKYDFIDCTCLEGELELETIEELFKVFKLLREYKEVLDSFISEDNESIEKENDETLRNLFGDTVDCKNDYASEYMSEYNTFRNSIKQKENEIG